MKLLIEENLITEAKETPKGWKISGVFMESDMKNRNGRIYPKRILDSAVNIYVKEEVDQNRGYSELNHPASPQINLDRVCCRITGLVNDNTKWVGEALVLSTPCGQIVEGLLRGGCQLGVSSRGLGSLVQREGYNEVAEDYRIAAVDCVSTPSCTSAYVSGLQESVDWIFDSITGSYIREELISKQQKFVKENYKKLTDRQKLYIFESFLNTF